MGQVGWNLKVQQEHRKNGSNMAQTRVWECYKRIPFGGIIIGKLRILVKEKLNGDSSRNTSTRSIFLNITMRGRSKISMILSRETWWWMHMKGNS